MSLHESRLLIRRKFRRKKRQASSLAERAETSMERWFFRRLDHLAPVSRFVVSWLLLMVLLCGCLVGQIRALDVRFQKFRPIAGGIYTEGILGDFTNANPLYASGPVDESVSRLLFSGLFKYNNANQLVGDLAENYSVDATGKVYTVILKPGLTWHDGRPLTAKDVEYTYKVIQNPDALSVLNQGWQNINVEAAGDRKVIFTLPSALGSFPYNMTNGIIPEHILRATEPVELRSLNFNTTNPIGSGPFKWNSIEVRGDSPENRQVQIAMTPFKHYSGGAPKLAGFIIHAFHDEQQLRESFMRREVTGAGFIDAPEEILSMKGVNSHSFMLSAADMVFFRAGNPVMAETAVRKALAQSVNVQAIIESLDYVTNPVRGPFLFGQLGYDKSLEQARFDQAAAMKALDAAGWQVGAKGVRYKANKPLKFTLYAQNMAETKMVSEQLQKAWKSVGADVTVKLESSDDLQRTISSRTYDALLYGISVGVDPDVFVYWHSSQNDVRSAALNFSEYKNKTADVALEAGRTRNEPDLRAVKYKPFLQAWQQDTPALGLYQPRYLYLSHGKVHGLKLHVLNTNADRFNSVHNWQIRQAEATNR